LVVREVDMEVLKLGHVGLGERDGFVFVQEGEMKRLDETEGRREVV
jgi:hypothetical protein